MKRISVLISIALFFVLISTKTGFAQTPVTQQSDKSALDEWKKQAQQGFEDFKAENEKQYRDFRAKANAEYADFMSQAWKEFQAYAGIPAPKSDDPIKQPEAKPRKEPTADPMPFDKIVPLPVRVPRPQPITPIQLPKPAVPEAPRPEPVAPIQKPTNPTVQTPPPEPAKPVQAPKIDTPKPDISKPAGYAFLFYNTECKVNADGSLRFTLPDASEKSAADAWKILSDQKYDELISDFLTLRDQMNLSDWGYFQLLKAFSEKYFDKESNEAVLFQMFVLTQSGYKVRIARTNNNRFVLLIPFKETIYEYTFLNIDGVKYYIINKDLKNQGFFLCNQAFPQEQYFAWQTGQPRLAETLTQARTYASKRYPEINVTVQTNQNLIDYFNNYPLSNDWNLYTVAGLSDKAKHALFSVLQRAIAGKSKTEAAGMFLNFLQTGFAYQTDAEQFGYERPFFPDENFFYPYNNCKDRATLYAIMVKELLGLDVVLLHYPGHLATAVHFNEDVEGDYLMINGKKFIVCDPTYIGANIGRAMDQFKNVSAKVVTIW